MKFDYWINVIIDEKDENHDFLTKLIDFWSKKIKKNIIINNELNEYI